MNFKHISNSNNNIFTFNSIAQRSRSATSPGMGASVAVAGGYHLFSKLFFILHFNFLKILSFFVYSYTNMFESGNQSPATATAAYGSIPQMGNGNIYIVYLNIISIFQF